MAVKAKQKRASNPGGWKTCSRGHKFRGPGPCPTCWPGAAQRGAKKAKTAKRSR